MGPHINTGQNIAGCPSEEAAFGSLLGRESGVFASTTALSRATHTPLKSFPV